MHELRCALVFGVNIVTVHARDPAAVVEDFDKFISACPEDIKSGLSIVLWEGRRVQCKRLFDALAVDWFDAPQGECAHGVYITPSSGKGVTFGAALLLKLCAHTPTTMMCTTPK
jgi:hypothetical protein